MSTTPFWPPVMAPPTQASTSPMTMAIAEPWMRPKVRRLEKITDTHMITPTNANAVTRPLCSRPFSMRSHISATSYGVPTEVTSTGSSGKGSPL